ncbi:unnamed protein product [Acanthoscelides obtectus]|nr:unnamed protein product [Acanthoscelides obtectus]CAK1625806.1 hypothetical protein AOBTE_LOCUS3412 [Acanthoscelides obtectus]
MGRSCYVCKINSNNPESVDISYHRLPADPAKRLIWMSLLGIDSQTILNKEIRICSKHFRDEGFKYDLAGRRFLNDGADPINVRPLLDEGEDVSTDSTVTVSPSKESSSESYSAQGSPVRK